MKGFRQKKQLTKAEKEAYVKRDDEARAFQKEYQAIVEKHKMSFGAGMFFHESGVIAPGIKLINLDPENKGDSKKRVKAFKADYQKLEESSPIALVAKLLGDDMTGEVTAKVEMQRKEVKD